MARYIDADRLSRQILDSWDNDNHRTIQASAVHRQEHQHLMRMIEKQPTADVVPKSEIERLQAELDSKQFRCDSCDRIMLTGAEHRHCIKQAKSEVIEEYRQRVNTKMGKHTHLLGKEYVQRILREVAKELKNDK